MIKYNVTGMSCAACSSRVEKAVGNVSGVKSVSVNLLTNSMVVEGDASSSDIIKAVVDAGYGATLKSSKEKSDDEELKDTQTPKLLARLIASVVFLIPLMYISMGHMMWGWSVFDFLNDNYIAMCIIQMLLAAIVMIINQRFFISGFKGVLHKSPNMDTLVALGSGASFIYSLYALLAMTDAQLKGNTDLVMSYMHEFYFESAAMILTLITVGKMLESHSKGKTTDAIKGLMNLAPKTATVIKDGEETVLSIEQVKIDDIFVVRPGESVPVDAVIVEGESAINESALTGESIPVDKQVGDSVLAATINQSGFIKCRATSVGEDTTISQIIKMVSDASATKAPIAKLADKVSGVFVPIVILIAAITIIAWLISGQSFGYALARGISVLVISCPCALGLATPVAVMVGNGKGAKHGILFKTAAALEETGRIQIVALDKTGTITRGEPRVTDIIAADGIDETELLSLAYSLEKKSEHPLSKAIIEKAENENIDLYDTSDFKIFAGNGLTAKINNDVLLGGSFKFISKNISVSQSITQLSEQLSDEGKTPLLFSKNSEFMGIIAVADVIKDDSAKAVKELENMGIRVVMLTGDNQRTANAISKQAGIENVVADVLPDGKDSVIKQLKKCGKVAMVGDGVNDAPALTSADIGIAIDAGADIAIDAADVVLMNSKLTDVSAAIRLSRATLTNIRENLFWAFIYNIIGIPLAAGLWIPIFGWSLNPMFAAAAMSLSSFCVVSNALRLNLFKIKNAKADRKIKSVDIKLKEINNMTKTMKIEGMMCPHCEATVKKTLEAFAQVDEAKVSHEQGTAVLTLNSDISDDELKKAVEDQGYKVL